MLAGQELGDRRAVKPLIHALDHGSLVNCPIEVHGVEGTADRWIERLLIRVLGHKNLYVRFWAAGMLGWSDHARWVKEPLIDFALEDLYDVREEAARALGAIGDRRALEALVRAIAQRRSEIRQTAAYALLGLVHQEGNGKLLEWTARRLWWRLTDAQDVANAAYEALEGTVARLTELEVEALGGEPDPFTHIPPKAGLSPALLIALSFLVAAISGIASNILAAYLQEQYQLITDPARIAIVVAVFLVTLACSIWIALASRKESSPAG